MKEERKLPIGDAQLMVIALIRAAMEERGYSGRRLSEESGIGNTRCAEILRGNRVLTIDEFDSMCRALGLIPWMVMREAEESLDDQEATVIEMPTAQAVEHYTPFEELPDDIAAKMGDADRMRGLAPDAGEESQVPPVDWD